MNFEVLNALNELDQRTPAYFLAEIFAHGDAQVRLDAIEILADLDPEQKSVRVLRELIKLT